MQILFHPQNVILLLSFLSTRVSNWMRALTCDVSPDDSLDRKDLSSLDPDSSSVKLVLVLLDLRRHLRDIGRDDMVRNMLSSVVLAQEVEEEEREGRQ
jgi:hypothetical protein